MVKASKGLKSISPKFVSKPSLTKVSESRVNQGINRARGEYTPGKSK